MEKIYLMHWNRLDILLMCDSQFNPLKEVAGSHLDARDMTGYVNTPYGYMGVYSSENGPILFLNNEKFPFQDQSWKVSIKEGETSNEVHFSNLNGKDLTFKYEKVELEPADPWSQKEFDDFFIWLSLKRNDQELIRMWTIKT